MGLSVCLSSCRKEVGTTAILILDSTRHYYPIVMGEDLDITYRLANIGKEPLVITDIQPSCGCVTADGSTQQVVPPGKEAKLSFVFDTNKNTGYVHHRIRIFGNIAPNGMAQMEFDCNVVPPTTSSVDYEENFHERKAQELAVKDLVDGGQGRRGYWTDEGVSDRNYDRYPWYTTLSPKQ